MQKFFENVRKNVFLAYFHFESAEGLIVLGEFRDMPSEKVCKIIPKNM